MTLLPERKIYLPAWLPPAQRRRLLGRRFTLRIPAGVRARLRTPERVLPSEWNERFRVMPASESYPGKWRRDIAPHAAWIMDLWALPSVRELWLCGPDQASKTSSMLGCIGWSIDQDPGNIFYTASVEDKTKEIVNDKLIGMLRESPRLRKRLSRKSDDTGMSKIKMNNGVTIRAAWSNSPASTASFAARYTFNDEVDKWSVVAVKSPDASSKGREASPIRRIRKRTKNYPLTYKHFWSSTPAGRYVHKGMLACQQIWTHAARCPDCNQLVVMDEEHMAIPDDATIDSIKADPESVGYACNACASVWDEDKRLQAYRQGDKLCLKGADIANPVDVGVHLTGFVTPDMRLSDIAITILQARSGDLDARIDLAHGIKCIDYAEEFKEREDRAVLLLRDQRTVGQVPSVPIAAITAVADMQKRGFWYTVRAWGYGLEQESWLLQHGYLDSWAALENIFFRSQYKDAAGQVYVPNLWAMDSGGGESEEDSDLSRTAEAYLFACKHPEVLLFKGNSRMSQMVTRMIIDKLPGTNKPLPGAPMGYNVNARIFKNRLAAKLMINAADPGAWHLHSGLTPEDVALGLPPEAGTANLEQFARQMCAEVLVDNNWENPTKRANHLWDCAYMELALAEIAQVKYWEPPAEAPGEVAPRQENVTTTRTSRRW